MTTTPCEDFDNGSRRSQNVNISQNNFPEERKRWYTRDAYFKENMWNDVSIENAVLPRVEIIICIVKL